MTQTYKGLCMGGPLDGQEIECRAPTMRVPVVASVGRMVDPVLGDLVPSGQSTFRYVWWTGFVGENRDWEQSFWLPERWVGNDTGWRVMMHLKAAYSELRKLERDPLGEGIEFLDQARRKVA